MRFPPFATIALSLVLACQFSASTSPEATGGEGKPAATPAAPASEAAADTSEAAPPSDPGDGSGETPAATDKIAAEPPTAEHPDHDPPKPSTPAATDKVTAATDTCDDGKHKKGDRWKVECNECWCGDDGQVACTRKGCVGPKK